MLIAAKAATKIQAVFRGHKVRETMKKSETKTATNNGASNAVAAANAAAAEAASSSAEPTKAELEAEFDPNDKGKWKFSQRVKRLGNRMRWDSKYLIWSAFEIWAAGGQEEEDKALWGRGRGLCNFEEEYSAKIEIDFVECNAGQVQVIFYNTLQGKAKGVCSFEELKIFRILFHFVFNNLTTSS